MTTTRSVESDDTYIHSLLPIGENSNHYSTNSDEENYNYIDEEATKDDIDIALAKYDRDEHFAFLLKEYMDCHYEISQRKVEVNI